MANTVKLPRPRTETYADKKGRFRWRSVARNGQVVATPGQYFASRWNAKRSAERNFPDVPCVAALQ